MRDCVGAPDERFEEKETRIAELEERIDTFEKENFRLKQDQTQARGTSFPKSGAGAGTEDTKMLKDITKQNAMLRRKLDDALQKVDKLEGRAQ
mmetsp:Transcript_36840/g.45026  ORF Transcript_36840/g.45026 Transcript_36840/m.45026 type:complete len:93 (+) Transcript_36840:848-1126(+)